MIPVSDTVSKDELIVVLRTASDAITNWSRWLEDQHPDDALLSGKCQDTKIVIDTLTDTLTNGSVNRGRDIYRVDKQMRWVLRTVVNEFDIELWSDVRHDPDDPENDERLLPPNGPDTRFGIVGISDFDLVVMLVKMSHGQVDLKWVARQLASLIGDGRYSIADREVKRYGQLLMSEIALGHFTYDHVEDQPVVFFNRIIDQGGN